MQHMGTLQEHRTVQAIAKAVLADLGKTIVPSDTESTIANRATGFLAERGVTETWYYACPALVLLGSRSTRSVSGRNYKPADERVGMLNLITVDLSPSLNGAWGDCARSFFVEDGCCVLDPSAPEFRHGVEVERLLHDSMRSFVSPDTTLEDLYIFANRELEQHGFENLDFNGNLGHSIASHLDERCYLEVGNKTMLGDVPFFTFEPHIREKNGRWGFKHENIYYSGADGRVEEL